MNNLDTRTDNGSGVKKKNLKNQEIKISKHCKLQILKNSILTSEN